MRILISLLLLVNLPSLVTCFLHSPGPFAKPLMARVGKGMGSCHSSKLEAAATTATTTASSATPSWKPYLSRLIASESLTALETESIWTSMLTNNFDHLQAAALLTLLRQKGETAEEITGMVKAMNEACVGVSVPGEKGKRLLDIVGTGGDGADTINISTAAVVLAAACGCVVAKAGNRSVSSACGSADVLEALGVKVDLSPAGVAKVVDRVNVAFMFAPVNHPSMRFVAPVRKALGVRTVFNVLGPMTNAAKAQRAVIGVFEPELQHLVADTLINIGRVDKAVVIHGCGLDEVSPIGASTIVEIERKEGGEYEKKEYVFDPLDVGVRRCTVEDLKGGSPAENKEEFRKVLKGGVENNAKRDAVVLNAAFGCYVYGLVENVEEGMELARKTLEEGKAADLLEDWIRVSNNVGE